MTKHYLYVCPSCKRPTATMNVAQEKYEPNKVDLHLRPDMVLIGDEILECPCGLRLTWFSVEQVEVLPL